MLVAVNEGGRRIGESHPRAKLTDHEVDLIRELAEQGVRHREIADKFDISIYTIKSISSHRRRAHSLARAKRADSSVALEEVRPVDSRMLAQRRVDQGPKYMFMQREVQRIAAELNWKPHQVQAAIWTAMKSRIDPIRDALKKREVRLGIGHYVDKVDPATGKTTQVYEIKPERRAEHFHLAHRMGMAHALQPQDIQTYDFSNAIRERMIQISWEATPGESTGKLPGIFSAPLDQQMAYLQAITEVINPGGKDLIAEAVGLPAGHTMLGYSAWKGAIGAGAQTFTAAPSTGDGKTRGVKQEARRLLDLYAAMKGYVLSQEAVVWHAPVYTDAFTRHNGYEIITARALNHGEMKALYGAINAQFGTWELAPGYTEAGARVLNFVDGLDNVAYHEGMQKVLESLPEDFGGGIIDHKTYRSDGEYIANDWIAYPNGEQYAEKLAAAAQGTTGRPDLQARAANLRARVETVNQRFIKKYGWDKPAAAVLAQPARDSEEGLSGARGQIAFSTDITASPTTITLLKNADLSTFLHETGHFFLEVMVDIANGPHAPAQIVDDTTKTLQWLGVPDIVTWRSMALEEKRTMHEQFARGFEAYLFEGKSPSLEVQSLFARFRAWLINVYRSLTALNVRLTDEVRVAMDRMLATSEQIRIAEAARGYTPLFANAEQAGMTPEQWHEYQELALHASDEAKALLETRGMRDMRWLANAKSRKLAELQRDAAQKRAAVEREVTAEVRAMPIYQAVRFLTHGELLDAEHRTNEQRHILELAGQVSTKFSLPALREMYGAGPAALWRYLPVGQYGMVSAEGGMSPDLVAELFGFSSGDELVRAILAAEKLSSVIEGMTDQRMLERYGDLSDPQAIERAAEAAIHNEARARFVATELTALSKATGQPQLMVRAARQFAEASIGQKRIGMLHSAQYTAAETRAARAAEDALKKGDTIKAAGFKRMQLLNHQLAAISTGALENVDKALRYLRKFDNAGTRGNLDVDYLDQIDQLLERFDLRSSVTNTELRKRKSLAAWIESQREQGFEPAIDPELLADAKLQHYRQLTVEEFNGLVDAVKNIEHLGRLKKKLLTAQDDREFGEHVAEVADAIKTNARKELEPQLENNRWRDRVRSGKDEFFAMHRKFSSLVREMDGFRDGGTVWELFVRPMNDRGAYEATQRERATEALTALFRPILKAGKLREKTYIPAIGASLSREGRLMVALNWGNDANRQRVMGGDGWNVYQVQAILDTLSREEWDFVQGVWDHLNSYWPQIAEKERRISGVAPLNVEATPVQTRFGQYAGGYFPIKYDPQRSSKAEADSLSEVVRQTMQGLYTRATTRRGHTKARIDEVSGRPVRKDFGVIFEHLDQVIHDLAWHEYLIDANRLLRAGAIDTAIRDHYGPEVLRTMKKVLEDIAAGEIGAQNVFERSVNHLRTGVSIAFMGWSVMTSLMQPLGLTQSVVRIGPKWVAKGLSTWLRDAASMESSAKWIYERSEFMRLRGKTMQREIDEIRNRVSTDKGKARSAVEDSYFWLIQAAQKIADIPTWLGAYEKAMAGGADEAKAIALADQAVLDSQGGGQIKDLAQIQRGSPLLKLWTNFYSFFSTTYNMAAESVHRTDFRSPMQIGRLAVDFLMLFTVPAVLGAIIRDALKGGDDDELAKKLIREQITYLLGTVVGLRELSAAAGGIFGYEGPAGTRFFSEVTKLSKQIGQGEVDEALLKSLNNAAGIVLHYPAAQIQRAAAGIAAIAEGKTNNPGVLVAGPPVD